MLLKNYCFFFCKIIIYYEVLQKARSLNQKLFEPTWSHSFTYIRKYLVITTFQSGLLLSFSHYVGMLCALVLYMSGRNYSSKSILNNFFEEPSMAVSFTTRVCPKSAERKSPKDYFSHISLCWRCLTWSLNLGFMSHKPTY